MSTNQPIPDALDDPAFRRQMQGLRDVTAALEGKPTSPVVFSTDPGSLLHATAKTRFLVVDGMDAPHKDGNYVGDGAYPPFMVFDVDAQQNIAGPFDDRKSANVHRMAILDGEPALLNADALWAYWGTHPTIQPGGVAKSAPSQMTDAVPLRVTVGEFNVRAHKALKDAWPLVQRGTIDSVTKKVKAVVDATPNDSERMYLDLVFALQDAWPYVHVRPDLQVTESRLALVKEFDVLRKIEPEHATTNKPGAVKVFTGYVNYDGIRIQVDFQAPKDASANDVDAAFLVALGNRVEVNYLEIGESDHSLIEEVTTAPVGIPADFLSHQDSWRDALVKAIKNADPPTHDMDDGAYWMRELAAFDRAYAELKTNGLDYRPVAASPSTFEAQGTTTDRVAQLTHERDVLVEAIANLAIKTGVTRPDAHLTGPDALMLCKEMAESFAAAQDSADLYRFLRDSYADQSDDDEAAFAALARTNGLEFDCFVSGAMVDARVKNLHKLAAGAGVGYTLSQIAGAASFATGGDFEDVDWPAVQESTVQEAMIKNGQDRGTVFNTLCEHSPAAITTEHRVALAKRIADVAAEVDHSKTQLAESTPRP